MTTRNPTFSNITCRPNIGPELVPLHCRGGDPIFNLSRSFWYSLDGQGFNVLVRLRRPGNVKGKTMLSIPRARSALARLERMGARQVRPAPDRQPQETAANANLAKAQGPS
jgi:hypothetical protein